MNIGDKFDQGCDYRLLCDFLEANGSQLGCAKKGDREMDSETPSQCAIRVMRQLMALMDEANTPTPCRFQIGDVVWADKRYARDGRITSIRYWEFPKGVTSSHGVYQVQIDNVDSWIAADHFRKPDDDLMGILCRLEGIESRVVAFGKSVSELHNQATGREFSTCDVLRDFEERLKQLESSVESIGRGTERHQVAMEKVNFELVSPSDISAILRHQAQQDKLVDQRFDNLCKSIADLASSQSKKASELQDDIEDILVRLPDEHPAPIPGGVYYSIPNDNFYSKLGGGMGEEFYRTWEDRRDDFPQKAMKDAPEAVASKSTHDPIFEVGDLVECKLEYGIGYDWHIGFGSRLTVDAIYGTEFQSGKWQYPNHRFKLIEKAKKPEDWSHLNAPAELKPPNDDDEPITEEWLVKSGLRQHREGLLGIVRLGDKLLLRQSSSDDVWEVSGQPAIEFGTRRDIRLFAELMRIELKETK